MINKLFKMFFNEKKACVTVMRNTPEIESNNELTYKRNMAKKEITKTCLSKYFINNSGLNYVERNLFA